MDFDSILKVNQTGLDDKLHMYLISSFQFRKQLGCSTVYYWENECTLWKTDIKDENGVQF